MPQPFPQIILSIRYEVVGHKLAEKEGRNLRRRKDLEGNKNARTWKYILLRSSWPSSRMKCSRLSHVETGTCVRQFRSGEQPRQDFIF